MENAVRDLLLNVLFVIIPVFMYQMFWLERAEKHNAKNPLVIGYLAGLSIILCMSFPVEIMPGYIFDLRMIPVIVAFLYSGWKTGMAAVAILTLYRLYLGGPGVVPALIIAAVMAASLLFAVRKTSRWKPRKRITAVFAYNAAALVLVIALNSLMFHHLLSSETERLFTFQFVLIQSAGALLAAYLIETTTHNFIIRTELVQTEKMRLVSHLAASVSHEVRNPLTVTNGFLQLLRQPDLSPEKRAKFIDIAMEELQRAERIIKDYLSLAKPQDAEFQELNIGQELSYVINILTPYATMNHVTMEVTSKTGDLVVMGDRQKFHQCMVNLVKNSIEAMPEGGIIKVRCVPDQQDVIVTISDTGVGMTREQIGRLGTPYFSSKEKGTGLGTMVAFSILQSMNGRVSVHSEPGKGTTFTIVLPASWQDEVQETDSATP